MSRLVKKFGGTSVADIDKIRKAAEIAVKAASEGHEVTTVVSAMGDTTDRLISMAEEITRSPNAREMDMLMTTGEQVSIALMSMAIQSLGYEARSFTGAQAGIMTGSQYGYARIEEVQPDAIQASLARGEIAVVAGFQGVTDRNELTTLGRGGSDTTAVALAAALNADCCDIYTDVDGVYTADPRILPEARRLDSISYEEMMELSATGAQVLATRSVELAMDQDVPLRVRSTFKPMDPGTLVGNRVSVPEYMVAGISCDTNQVSVMLKGARNTNAKTKPADGLGSLFTRLQELNIQTDMVMLLAHEDASSFEAFQEIAFSVDKKYLARVKGLIDTFSESLGNPRVSLETEMAKISVVGRRFSSRPEMVASVFETLQAGGIPVNMVATGDLRMSMLMPKTYAVRAVKLIHDCFGLAEGSFLA